MIRTQFNTLSLTGLIACAFGVLCGYQALRGGEGAGWQCVPWDDSDRDRRGFFDVCVFLQIPANKCDKQACTVTANLPNSWYCTQPCKYSPCSCYGWEVTGSWSLGECTHDSGPDPCYCRYDEYGWRELTVHECAS
jgi:hypothetical protein